MVSVARFLKESYTIIVKQVISKTLIANQSAADSHPETVIWFRLQYCGNKSVQLANSCIRKIKRY